MSKEELNNNQLSDDNLDDINGGTMITGSTLRHIKDAEGSASTMQATGNYGTATTMQAGGTKKTNKTKKTIKRVLI